MRLDKFLAHQMGISRNLVARELRAGMVTVDGEVVKNGALKVSAENECDDTRHRAALLYAE